MDDINLPNASDFGGEVEIRILGKVPRDTICHTLQSKLIPPLQPQIQPDQQH